MKNITSVPPNNPGVSRTYRPGQNASPPAVSHAESSGLVAEADAKRREYLAEDGKARAQMADERARQAGETD
jgi:hypothetical protein